MLSIDGDLIIDSTVVLFYYLNFNAFCGGGL